MLSLTIVEPSTKRSFMPQLLRDEVDTIYIYSSNFKNTTVTEARIEVALRLRCHVTEVPIDTNPDAWRSFCVVHRVSENITPQFLVQLKNGKYFHICSYSRLKELLPPLRFQCHF